MKKSFKLIAAVAVFLTLGITFMANSYKTDNNTKAENPPPCWINPQVDLTGDCVKYNENANYVVHMTIVDVCSNPYNVLYDSTKTFLSDVSTTHFCVPNQLCTVDQAANCFVVYVSAIKKDNTTGEVICSGNSSKGPYNCEELMGFNQISVPLN